jgi:hypothetical protein
LIDALGNLGGLFVRDATGNFMLGLIALALGPLVSPSSYCCSARTGLTTTLLATGRNNCSHIPIYNTVPKLAAGPALVILL